MAITNKLAHPRHLFVQYSWLTSLFTANEAERSTKNSSHGLWLFVLLPPTTNIGSHASKLRAVTSVHGWIPFDLNSISLLKEVKAVSLHRLRFKTEITLSTAWTAKIWNCFILSQNHIPFRASIVYCRSAPGSQTHGKTATSNIFLSSDAQMLFHCSSTDYPVPTSAAMRFSKHTHPFKV